MTGLFVKYGATMNCGATVIFDDLIEFNGASCRYVV
jgi:hypothetical protein